MVLSMYLFTYRARVNPKSSTSQKYRECGGAYVSCYVSFKDYDGAKALAKFYIRDQGWIPGKMVEESRVQKSWCKKKLEKQCYSEAIKYGYSMIFNMWRKDAPDAAIDYEAKENKSV
jgi:hypothetical protein